MVNLKKWFVCILFCLPMLVSALSVTPAKASTLDERVGALAVDTALSSFINVLPTPSDVEKMGGVRSWLSEVGSKFKQAWENDGRNWQSFIENAATLVSDVFDDGIEVVDVIRDDIRAVLVSAFNFVFGIEYEEEPPFDATNTGAGSLGWYIDSYNAYYSMGYNCAIWFGDLDSNGYQKSFNNGYWEDGGWAHIYWSDNVSNQISSSYSSYGTIPYGNYYINVPISLTVLYWGNPPSIVNWQTRQEQMPTTFAVNYVNMATWGGDSDNDFTFVPSVDSNYFNKYYFGFGNTSNISPSRIVNNYETIYNYVTNNYYTDAVREIKEEPKEYYVNLVGSDGDEISVGGIGDITINLPNADGFGNLFGEMDTSEVFAIENSNWLSVLNILPQSVLIMFFIAIAVGCTCVVIKAVK